MTHASVFRCPRLQVMATDPHILARRYADRWMVKALGCGLHGRPVWRRETEDLRALLLAVARPSKADAEGAVPVVRPKAGSAAALPPLHMPALRSAGGVEGSGNLSVGPYSPTGGSTGYNSVAATPRFPVPGDADYDSVLSMGSPHGGAAK